MKKLICLLLCCAIAAFPFAGCRKDVRGKNKFIRYDIPKAVLNLDPQFATDISARMIIANINEGLLTQDENGKLVPGVAESYEISADGQKLTFKLRENALWANGKPVTADDFVFALRRLFTPGAPSPFAGDYIAIENAEEILAGTKDLNALGVVAKGKNGLEIRLGHPSPYFPSLLAETPAMPCNEEFFDESRGRYALDIKFISANGPFYLERWDNETSIYLRPNSRYTHNTPANSGGVNLHIGDEDTTTRLQSGASDAAQVSFDDAEKLKNQNYSITSIENTTWCIAFNQNSYIWGNPLLRQGLSYTIDPELLSEKLPQKLTPTNLLIPPAGMLADKKYRENVNSTPAQFDPELGRRLFEMGISALPDGSVSGSTFYVPDSAGHMLAMGMVQQSWQKHLSAYINVEPDSVEQIKQRFLTGDYDILLMPLSLATPNAQTMLSMFTTNSPDNCFGYDNQLYNSMVDSLGKAPSLDAAREAYARAESLLLQDAVIIPVYFETTAFATVPDVKGIRATPYPTNLYFKYAEK